MDFLEAIVAQNDELYHHGIMGMKWGIRRYQNRDGSLTEEGRKRYEEIYNKQREAGHLNEYRKTVELEKRKKA